MRALKLANLGISAVIQAADCMTLCKWLRRSSYQWSFFELFIWARGLLYFHSCPTLSSSPTYKHMRCPMKVSNILCTPVKFSKNPSGKTLQNCFIHKSSTRSAKRNEQNSYYSPPLLGKSNVEDTITTHCDWKKLKRILENTHSENYRQKIVFPLIRFLAKT